MRLVEFEGVNGNPVVVNADSNAIVAVTQFAMSDEAWIAFGGSGGVAVKGTVAEVSEALKPQSEEA